MATFTCTLNPNLVVLKPSDIQFVNGTFTTEDPRLIGVLRDIINNTPNSSGIVESVVESDPNVNAAANVDSSADNTNPQNFNAQGI